MTTGMILALLMFVCLLIGLSLGHPLAFTLGGIAVIFGYFRWSPECFGMFIDRIYMSTMNSYILVATIFAACTGIVGASVVTSCPVYRVTREETTVPRAKVHLIRNFAHESLPATDRMQEKLQFCLMCGTCTSMCPDGVQHDILFMRMRHEMGARRGRSKEVKVAEAILPRENRLRLASKAARLGTSSLADAHASKDAHRQHSH